MRLAPWYPGTVKPVRKGVYDFRFPNGAILRLRWDGRRWKTWANNVLIVIAEDKWRGLAEPPRGER
jgi:putative component of toxin-antitoxin plasmid stabilization module